MPSRDVKIQIPSDFRGLDHSKALHIRERNLPHWRQDGATYFITFRLADSIPREVFIEIEREADHWRERAAFEERKSGDKLSPAFLAEWEIFQRRQLTKIETTMDSGQGSCVLSDPANRSILADALHFFNHQRYTLHAFVIMPNHVHMAVTPHAGWDLGKLLQSWKGFSSRQINQHLGRQGILWQRDSFDRIVRHEEHFVKVIRYIAGNPEKVKLPPDRFTLWLGDCVEPAATDVNAVMEDIAEYGEDFDVW